MRIRPSLRVVLGLLGFAMVASSTLSIGAVPWEDLLLAGALLVGLAVVARALAQKP